MLLITKSVDFIEEYYFNGRTYEEIGNKVYYELYNQTRNSQAIKRTIKTAINKMLKL